MDRPARARGADPDRAGDRDSRGTRLARTGRSGRAAAEAGDGAMRSVAGTLRMSFAVHAAFLGHAGRAVHRLRHAERACYFSLTAALVLLAASQSAHAQRFATNGPYNTPAGKSPTADMLREVGIEQHLDAPLPLDATFRDEAGRTVRLGDYFSDKPV